MQEITISSDSQKLNFELLFQFLSNTYWGKGRSREMMETLIRNSFNVGIYLGSEQIGYARAVSDFAQFAYLMDVFVLPEHRGKGYAYHMLDYLFHESDLKDVLIWRLATTDAHGLYAKFGFTPLSLPQTLMEWKR